MSYPQTYPAEKTDSHNYADSKLQGDVYATEKSRGLETGTHPAREGVIVEDAVFGEIDDKGPNYRAVSFGGAFVLMCKANVGLGILQIPFVFMSIGLVPGIILLILMNILTIYTASLVQSFKLNHPQVYGYADIGEVLFGRIGREIFSVIFFINFVFVSASAIVAVSISLNAISLHAVCTAVFVVVAAIVGWLLCAIKTLGSITWLGWVGMISILASVITLAAAVGVQDRPAQAPKAPEPWDRDLKIFAKAGAIAGISAITNVLYAYAATPAYWGIISEMRDPRKYNRVMVLAQVTTMSLYIVIGSVVYHFCGQYVSSPALGSAGVLMKRVCYGLAIPALLVSLCIWSHLAAKFLFVRILTGSEHLARPTFRHWATWFGSVTFVIGLAYILASAIPTFDAIVGFIGSLLTPQTTILVFPLIWWHDNWRYKAPGTRNIPMALLNVFIFCCGLFFVVGGMYAAVTNLIDVSATNGPWTCNDNSGSV